MKRGAYKPMLLRPSTYKSKLKYKLSAHRSKDALGARTGATVEIVDVAGACKTT